MPFEPLFTFCLHVLYLLAMVALFVFLVFLPYLILAAIIYPVRIIWICIRDRVGFRKSLRQIAEEDDLSQFDSYSW